MDQDRAAILAGYRRAEQQVRARLAHAAPADLERPSTGTRWTNEELLFHMVFGYMVVRALLPVVRVVGHLPRPWARAFAAVLDSATVPFDLVNYWGSRAAALFYNRRRMGRKMHGVLAALGRQLERETPASLAVSMPFPIRWDPFFTRQMTLLEVYAYPTLHFDFHAAQLDLPPLPPVDPA